MTYDIKPGDEMFPPRNAIQHCTSCTGTDYIGRPCRQVHGAKDAAHAKALAEALRWCYEWEQRQSFGQWGDERTFAIEQALTAYDKDHER